MKQPLALLGSVSGKRRSEGCAPKVPITVPQKTPPSIALRVPAPVGGGLGAGVAPGTGSWWGLCVCPEHQAGTLGAHSGLPTRDHVAICPESGGSRACSCPGTTLTPSALSRAAGAQAPRAAGSPSPCSQVPAPCIFAEIRGPSQRHRKCKMQGPQLQSCAGNIPQLLASKPPPPHLSLQGHTEGGQVPCSP